MHFVMAWGIKIVLKNISRELSRRVGPKLVLINFIDKMSTKLCNNYIVLDLITFS
jgi:hypothetical protein